MIRLGVMGLGGWGQHLVQSIQGRSTSVGFVAATSPPDTHVESFAAARNLQLFADPEQMVAQSRLDGIVIATPHSLHPEHVAWAARRGFHVFVEKPLAVTGEEARQAVGACAAAGVGLFVGFNWRFKPAARDLADIAGSGELGELLHFEGNYSGPSGLRRPPGSWRSDPRENPAGGMTGRGIHVLNLMNLMAGDVSSVYAFNDRRIAPQIEDTTSVLLRFASGLTGYVGAIQATAEHWRLQVFGSKGWAEMRGEKLLVKCLLDRQPIVQNYAASEPEREELEAFADAISQNRWCPVHDGVHAVDVLEAIDVSARENRRIDVRR